MYIVWIIKENILIYTIPFNIQSNIGTEWPSFSSVPSSSSSSHSPSLTSLLPSNPCLGHCTTGHRWAIINSPWLFLKMGQGLGLCPYTHLCLMIVASIVCLQPQKHLPSGGGKISQAWELRIVGWGRGDPWKSSGCVCLQQQSQWAM